MHSGPLRARLFTAQSIMVAENEALPQRKALWSAESEAKNHAKISNFPTFLLSAATLATLAPQQQN